jgi:hypothetical protein
MLTNRNFKELLSTFRSFNVRFLVVGGYAVMRYAEPRYTKDLDLWVGIDPENARRTYDALKSFGAPLAGLTADDFTDPKSFYQMGVPPLRIDIMFFLTGLDFETAWKHREELHLDDVTVPFISIDDLIAGKKALGRPQDLIDVANLEKARR